MKNSNVAIAPNTNEILTEFCAKTKLTKKDFIEASLKYFNDYSINPAKHEKPSVEIEKMHKRIEDLIKIVKAQERDIFRPSFEIIISTLAETSEERKMLIHLSKTHNQNRIRQFEEITTIHSKAVDLLKEENLKTRKEVELANEKIKVMSRNMTSMESELSRKLKIIVDNQAAGMTGKKQIFE